MFVEEKVLPHNPPTLAGFMDWLAHQPPQKYDYADVQRCALGQYYASIGRRPERFASELFENYEAQGRYMLSLGCVDV